MKKIKMIALDLDGTLFDENMQIAMRDIKAIKKAQQNDVKVTVATGRAMSEIRSYIGKLNLTEPIVTLNGGVIWKNTETIFKKSTLDHEDIIELCELADRYNLWYWAYAEAGLFTKEKFKKDKISTEWFKFIFYAEDNQKREKVLEILHSSGKFEISNSSPYNIEVNPKGVHKANGLKEICKMNEITMNEVMTIGDSLNDIQMIKEAGLGIAMKNAQNEVKNVADAVTESNKTAGVAHAIEKYIEFQKKPI